MAASRSSPGIAAIFLAVSLLVWTFRIVESDEGDLIGILPGQPDVTFKQYGGYVSVNDKHLFYYFVEAESEPEKRPLTLWLTEGPICSPVGVGAFSELGPFFPTKTGDGLQKNDNAWNQVSNIIFLESPVGIGFSYSDNSSDYVLGDDQTAQDNWEFILGWFQKFPQYQGRDFYIAGEGYAGHYATQLAEIVLEYNNIVLMNLTKISLRGILLGNPILDLPKMDASLDTMTFWWSHTLISDDTYNAIVKECGPEIPDNLSEPCRHAFKMAFSEASLNFVNIHDVSQDTCDYSIRSTYVEKLTRRMSKVGAERSKLRQETISVCAGNQEAVYLNRADVQEALHSRPTAWTLCPSDSSALNYSVNDAYRIMSPIIQQIMELGVRVWIYSGDQDAVITFLITRKIVANIAHNSNLNATTPYTVWFDGSQVGGWSLSWGENLKFLTVKGAGSYVATTKPRRALTLFSAFIQNGKLPSKITMPLP